jgi:hypothetical protein
VQGEMAADNSALCFLDQLGGDPRGSMVIVQGRNGKGTKY